MPRHLRIPLVRRRRGDDGASRRERRSRWRIVLLGGLAVLIVYYSMVLISMRSQSSGTVALEDRGVSRAADRVTLQVEAANLDPSAGSFDLQLRPLPRGELAGDVAGQLREPLRVQLASSGQPPSSFDFPADQTLDQLAASVETSTGAHRFPFDRPDAAFRLEAFSRDRPVPIDIEMLDATEGWKLAGQVQADEGDGLDVRVEGQREMLSISFALFYIGGIVVVALITVAVIGGAIARGRVDFDQVIWLGAMLVAIPAVRNEMPGVPPVGTAVDMFVFLPSVVIVATALLAAIVVLAINEAASSAPLPDAPAPDPE